MSTIEEHRNTKGLAVRSAQSEDMPAVAAIFEHYVLQTAITFELHPPSIEDWRTKHHDLTAQGWPFLVATVDEQPIGYAYVMPWRSKPAYRHTVENTIYIAPEHTGRGYGRALLDELLARAGAAGAREVLAVIADTGNPASIALHQRAGFNDAGRLRRVGHKHGMWLDTVLMQASLAAHTD